MTNVIRMNNLCSHAAKRGVKVLVMAVMLATTVRARVFASDVASSEAIPLLYDGCTIRIPVTAFGGTRYLIVDTGSTVSGFSEDDLSRLGTPIGDAIGSTLSGSGTTIKLYHAPEFTIGHTRANLNQVAGLNLGMITQVSGSPCDGVLGIDFLKNYIVTVDFDRHSFTFAKASKEIKRASIAVPMQRLEGGHVAVEALMNGEAHVSLMIDTGDNGSLSLSAEPFGRAFHGAAAGRYHSVLAVSGSGSPTRMSMGEINSLAIGPIRYAGLFATLLPNPKAPSTIGLRLLRRHIVTLDFPNGVLYLEPSSLAGETEHPDMSGLHLLRQDHNVVIFAIDENSSASDAGVLPGDLIRSIDGADTGKMTMRDIRRKFKSTDGEKISLSIKRGAQAKDCILVLKNPFARQSPSELHH